MDVSVVIPVRNAAAHVGEQLAALARQTTDLAYEVVVADNGSTDDTRGVVEGWRDRLPALTVVDASLRPGAAYARNVGAANTSGTVLAFCDADDWAGEGWVQAAFEATRHHCVAAGLVTQSEGTPLNPEVQEAPTSWRVLSGNFAIRAETFNAVGGFDASLPAYAAEDMDFSLRLRAHGTAIGSAPRMVVRFRPTASARELLRKVYLNAKGEVLVQARHNPGAIPSRRRTVAALAVWPVSAGHALIRSPSWVTARTVARDLVRRVGHVSGRVRLRVPASPIATALLLAPVSNLAGVARHIIDVATVGLPGWRVVVAAPEGPLLEHLRRVGAAVQPVRVEPGVPVPTAVRQLRSVIRTLRPDVVHSHLARADILSALATPGLRPLLVSTEHHISPDRLMFHSNSMRATIMEAVHHLRLKRFAALIAVSESTRRDLLRYWRPRQDVVVIRNGVDRPATPSVRPSGLRFLSLTRLSAEKNVAMTVRVFARIHASHPQARLTVAGTGDEEMRLKAQAHALGITDAVNFAGFIDPIVAMSEHDVILQPSLSDNLSYTLIDAVANGLGVVASSIGGNPEILPAHCIADTDEDFVDAALVQALDPSRRPVLPPSIPTVVEMCAQIVDVYSSVMSRP